jgi:hypothetical protein
MIGTLDECAAIVREGLVYVNVNRRNGPLEKRMRGLGTTLHNGDRKPERHGDRTQCSC